MGKRTTHTVQGAIQGLVAPRRGGSESRLWMQVCSRLDWTFGQPQKQYGLLALLGSSAIKTPVCSSPLIFFPLSSFCSSILPHLTLSLMVPTSPVSRHHLEILLEP